MSVMTFLFIPVSSVEGIGEYTRSLIIAERISKKWPAIKIYFVLSKQAHYFDSCPFEVIPTEQSATKDYHAINVILENIKPDFVLFDASGRAKNFCKAKEIGAKVAFISQHEKKRSRGLKLNRLQFIDQHWVVQPSFAIAPLNYYQISKLRLCSQKRPKNIGAVFERVVDEGNESLLIRYQLPNDFFVFNAGSGGHKKSNRYCIEEFYKAANIFSKQSGMHCVVVLGDNYPKGLPSNENVTCIKSLEHLEFIQLLMMAKGRLVSAGGTILQCIALLLPSISVAISSDQPTRLKACLKNKLVLASRLEHQHMLENCHQLLSEKICEDLKQNMKMHQTEDALTIITRDIAKLVNLTM